MSENMTEKQLEKQQKKDNKEKKKQEKLSIKENKATEKALAKENRARLKDKEFNTRNKYLHWYKLDNSAHLFPVIAGENKTNTYRVSVDLKEDINPVLLQQALDELLPKFLPFNIRLRKGMFWYFFEENGRRAPIVKEDAMYPCSFIHSKLNREYLFRVTYYKKRINLEVFHVLTDGMGALNFLKEIVYHYLRLLYPDIAKKTGNGLTAGTSMNIEDSFLKNYRKKSKPVYATKKAYIIKGEKLRDRQLGVMHVKMPVSDIKETSHRYEMTINEYLVGNYVYSIYMACLKGNISKRDIRVAVPVNLRGYFDSVTVQNFFVMISAELSTKKEFYSYEEVLRIVRDSLRSQMDKDHLEEIFSYNVSNQMSKLGRIAPLWAKKLAISFVYTRSALANTSTMTNIGSVKLEDEYKSHVDNFHAVLSMSKGQMIKGTICSYENTLTVTLGSRLRNTYIQELFIKQLAKDGIDIMLETNGVYYG